MNEATMILLRIVAIAVGGLGGYVLLRLKDKLDNDALTALIGELVAAAEQVFRSKIDKNGNFRRQYVIEGLKANGVKYISLDIDDKIEAAVYNLNLEQEATGVKFSCGDEYD